MKVKNRNWDETMGWIGITACIICCTLPVIGAIVGIGALTAGANFEKTAISIFGVSGILFALHFYKKKKNQKSYSATCDRACNCREKHATEP